MPVKINIAIAFLAFFALCNDAYIIQRGLRCQFPIKKFQDACLKSSKWVSPKLASSPVQIGLDSGHGDGTKRSKQPFTFTPRSTTLFKMLDMVVLPSGEILVLREKLRNYTLPENNQFQTMLSIAAWCLQCLSEPIATKRSHCVKQQLNFIGSDDDIKFKRFSERIVTAINEYYYKNFVMFFE